MNTPSSYHRIADFLDDRGDKIIAVWLREVRRDERVPSADNLPQHELVDHLPMMLKSLSEALRGLDARGKQKASSQKHGEYRWTQSYTLSELLRELAVLREVLAAEFLAYFRESGTPDLDDVSDRAILCLHRFLDNEVAYSVREFVARQQAEIQENNRSLVLMNERIQIFNTHLEQLDSRRLQMLRTVAHELGNHLQGLTIIMSLVKTQVDSEIAKDHFGVLSNSLASMSRLTEQLLEYASLLSGRERVRVEACDLGELHREISEYLRPMAAEKGLEFQGRCDPSLGVVPCDRQKLYRVCVNLGTNAVKYTDAGSVMLNFADRGGTAWAVEVVDTGIGLSEEERKRIFQEFYRVPGVHEEQRGAGLGLAITEKLVKLLGGSLEVESEPERGSCFRVILSKIDAP